MLRQERGVIYRHTDNLMRWLRAMKQIGFPEARRRPQFNFHLNDIPVLPPVCDGLLRAQEHAARHLLHTRAEVGCVGRLRELNSKLFQLVSVPQRYIAANRESAWRRAVFWFDICVYRGSGQ